MKGRDIIRRDPLPALLLAAGFVLTSVVAYGLVWATGAALFGSAHGESRLAWIAASVTLTFFLLIEARVLRFGVPMWHRQTPKWFVYKYGDRTSAFLWGLDAGLVVTTYRVTSLSWAAFCLAFLGAIPWWSGIFYAAGFVIPELVLNLALPRRADSRQADPEPGWVMDAMMRLRPVTRWAGVGALIMGAGVATVTAAAGA